jgi:hypothetical protein
MTLQEAKIKFNADPHRAKEANKQHHFIEKKMYLSTFYVLQIKNI